MKKFYLTAIIASICNIVLSQGFIVPTTYRGAFAPAPTAQWTDTWTNFDPQNTNYPAANVVQTANITNNTIWTANNTYLLQGQIYVTNGATLTIQPGTHILGDKSVAGSGLFITQGSKLVADGTAANPIVFTSNQPANGRGLGDWGGVILMGRASYNGVSATYGAGIGNIEGITEGPNTQFGGGANPNDNDNSGVLRYVRIEFAGYVYFQNKEINGLTLGAVGRGTTIDNVQVSFANDDAFEWFGGTVNCRHLVSYRNLDDDFDTDNGFSGKIQFGLVVRDPNISDNPAVSNSTSEGFESDNNASGDNATPQTSAIFSNITFVGPLRGNVSNSSTVANGYRRGARIRRNSGLKIYNSLFMDALRGIHIDGQYCEQNAAGGTSLLLASNTYTSITPAHTSTDVLKYKNNVIAGYVPNFSTERNSGSTFDIKTWFGANNNDSVVSSSNILVNPYGDNNGDFKTNVDFRPVSGSVLLTNYAFTDAALTPSVIFEPVATTAISYCVGQTASALTATATTGNTINWYTDATGTTLVTNLVPSTATAGVFNYYAAQANSTGIEGPRTLVTVTVHANPTAPVITANGSTSLCTGTSVDLISDQVSNNVWSTSATTQTITVSTSGTYSLVYTDANQCSATSNAITVNVSNAPLPTVQVSGSLSLCQGDSVVLTASTSDSYLWAPNGETTQSITVNTAATYYVTTTNANACNGVGQSANEVVAVTPQPTAVATFVITNGSTVTFTNTSSSATSYSWDFGDFNSSSAQNPTHVFPDFNNYTVVLTAINGGCQDTAVFNLTTLSVKEIANDNSTFVSIYPNPMTEMGTIIVDVKEYTPISIVITDNKGAIVNEVLNQNLEVGKHEISVDTKNFENGLYYVIVRTSKSNNITKINVIK